MSSDEHAELFELYAYIQDLMARHMELHDMLKDLSMNESRAREFEPVELASSDIVALCEDMQKYFNPKKCNCCGSLK